MGALGVLNAGLTRETCYTAQFCLLEISIAFGAHDTRLGSQRELRKRALFPGLLLDDRNSQTVTFESDKPRISLDHKSGQEVPLPLFIHPSAEGESTVSKITVKAHSAP